MNKLKSNLINFQLKPRAQKIIACVLIFTLFTFSMYGKTYYVSTSGNDSNDGLSTSKAWKTVTYAATMVTAGDIVYIKAGYYKNEYVLFSNSGTSSSHIVLQGYYSTPGDTPSPGYTAGDTINSKLIPVLYGISGSQILNIDGRNYIEVRNMGLSGGTYGCNINSASYITIENLYLSRIGLTVSGVGVSLYDSNNITINKCVVTDAGMHNYDIYSCNTVTVTNSISYAVEYSSDATDYHIVIGDSHDITVSGCLAYNLHSYSGGHPGHGIGIKDTYKSSTYPYPHSYNVTIDDCKTYDMGEYFFVSHYAYNNTFKNCTAVGHYETALQNSWSEGINIRDGAHDNTFYNCSIRSTATSLTFQNTGEGPTDAYTYNNVIKNCIFMNSGKGIEAWNANNNTIKNCVFDSTGRSLFFDTYSSSVSGDSMRNSIVTNSTGTYLSGTAFAISYSDFYNNSYSMPTGTGNISKSPLFVDQTNKDYHLKSVNGHWDSGSSSWVKDSQTSPCIDAGNPSDDYSSEPSPNGKIINMGAYGGTAYASKSLSSSSINSVDAGLKISAYPNPFNQSTKIEFSSDNTETIVIEIRDNQGRLINKLFNQKIQPGNYHVYWAGLDKSGNKVSHGIYFLLFYAGTTIKENYKIIYQ